MHEMTSIHQRPDRASALCWAAVILLLMCAAQAASASTLLVPLEYSTIQAGINAAQAGDEVVIADGRYSGPGNINLNFNGKAITVRSANGAANCIIDCQNLGRGFIFSHDETFASILQGVTIQFGTGTAQDPEAGSGSTVRIPRSSSA